MSLQASESQQVDVGGSLLESTDHPPSRTARSYEKAFFRLAEAIEHQLKGQLHTHFTLSLAGEDSQFTRFNRARVRQTGQVQDGQIRLTLMAATDQSADSSVEAAPDKQYCTASVTLPFVGCFAVDWAITQPALIRLQQELTQLPIDPYVVLPEAVSASATEKAIHVATSRTTDQSREIHQGHLPSASTLAGTILSPVQTLDFSGLYAGGISYRAYADSAGKQHWFETPSFTLDYSLFGDRPNQAVKGTLAGRRWRQSDYTRSIQNAQAQLQLSARPVKHIPRGRYRTYLAPAAVADIIDTIAWGGGLGEAALRQGNSAFSKLEQSEAILSEQFSLEENFQRVGLPRFNDSGEMAPPQLPIIHRGRWVNALINGRSAKEYGKLSNGANREEAMRAPAVAPGNLKASDILTRLDTGLYVSNVHYLNWSDLSAGRITGMTRYACFWVENGEIVAPIENLRFDDDLYRFLGEGLIGLSDRQTFIPTVGTYDRRSLGGMWVPGMLIEDFRYTL